MKIYDRENNRVLREVDLFLTSAEASRLAEAATDLAKSQRNHHHHVCNDELTSEILLSVYTSDNLHSFDEVARKSLADEFE